MDLLIQEKIECSILNGLGYIVHLEKKNGSKNIASDVFTSAPYIEHEVRR